MQFRYSWLDHGAILPFGSGRDLLIEFAMKGSKSDKPKDVIALLRKWIEISPVYATNLFREVCGFDPEKEIDHIKFLDQRNEFISSSLSLSYEQPVRMVKAAFQYMYDDRGNTFLDCVNNICHVGHCHPKVIEAGRKQMADDIRCAMLWADRPEWTVYLF